MRSAEHENYAEIMRKMRKLCGNYAVFCNAFLRQGLRKISARRERQFSPHKFQKNFRCPAVDVCEFLDFGGYVFPKIAWTCKDFAELMKILRIIEKIPGIYKILVLIFS